MSTPPPPEPVTYPSFNSLRRQPLIFGVPVILLVFSLCAMLLTGFAGVALFGVAGLMLPLLIAASLVAVRFMCQQDPLAAHKWLWDMKGLLIRLRCKRGITSLTPATYTLKRRKSDARQWLKNHTLKR